MIPLDLDLKDLNLMMILNTWLTEMRYAKYLIRNQMSNCADIKVNVNEV